MKNILSIIVFIFGIVLACYCCGWLLFVKPIIECCKAFDSDTLTGLMIGISVLKCMFASTVAAIIVWISSIVSALIQY